MLKKVPMKVLVNVLMEVLTNALMEVLTNVLNQLPQPRMSQCRFKKKMVVMVKLMKSNLPLPLCLLSHKRNPTTTC